MFRRSIFLLLFLFVTAPIGAQDGVPAEQLADPDGQFVELDGVRIYYIERGEPDDPTVLLLHGFGGSTFTWRDNIDVLVDAGYHVVAYDRPPFGLSDKRPDFDPRGRAQAAQAVALMDALRIESAVLVGHSAGGGVIAHIAIVYPERVKGLVFVAGAVPVLSGELGDSETELTTETEPGQGASPFGGMGEFACALDPESPAAQALVRVFLTPERFLDILESAYHPSYPITDEVAEGYLRVLRVEGWEAAFIALFSSEGDITSLDSDSLAGITVPVLIVWGEDDTWVPVQVGQNLLAVMPNAEWIVYPEVGHLPMEENVEQFNADLLGFLGQIEWD